MADIPLVIESDPEEPGCAAVFVDVMVCGHEYRCLLDTGAARTQLPSNELTKSFPLAEGTRESGSVFGRRSWQLGLAADVRVGSVVRHDVPIALAAEPTAPSLLGLDVLRHYSWCFCFSRAVLVEQPASAGASLPLELGSAGHIYLPAALCGAEVVGIWDSGAGISVVDDEFYCKHEDWFRPLHLGLGTDSVGMEQPTAIVEMPAVEVGGETFPPSVAAVVDLGNVNTGSERKADVVFGLPLYCQADWFFDFPGEKWAVTRIG